MTSNAFDLSLQLDALSTQAVNGSVISWTEDSSFEPQDPAVAAALASQRLDDFMADAHLPPTYTLGRGESVAAAERLTAQAMQDFDLDFERASQR